VVSLSSSNDRHEHGIVWCIPQTDRTWLLCLTEALDT
jgi:hypothetical protein